MESPSGDSFPIGDFIGILSRHKWLIAGCLGATLAAGTAYLKIVSPVYEVSAQVMVEQENLQLGQLHTRFLYDQAFLATQSQIMCSPAVVQPVAYSPKRFSVDPDSSNPVDQILESLTVKPVHGTNVIDVGFRDTDGTWALSIVEDLIASYRDHLRESQFNSHDESLKLLTRYEKELRAELDGHESEYQAIRTRGSKVGLGKEASNVHLGEVNRLGSLLNTAQNQRIDLENQLHTISEWRDAQLAAIAPPQHHIALDLPRTASQAGNNDSLRETIPVRALDGRAHSPAEINVDQLATLPIILQAREIGLPDLEAMLLALFQARVREKELAQVYGDKNASLQAVREEIVARESLIRQRIEMWPVLLASELDAVRRKEQSLLEMYQQALEPVKQMDQQTIEEERALGSIHRVQLIHDSILTQVRNLQLQNEAVAEGRSGIKVTVLAAPMLNENPVWPSPMIVLGMCGTIGLIGGFRLAVGRDRGRRLTQLA